MQRGPDEYMLTLLHREVEAEKLGLKNALEHAYSHGHFEGYNQARKEQGLQPVMTPWYPVRQEQK